jgi:mRNA interferase MazF
MRNDTASIRRGDIVLVDLRGAEGREKAGIRPCVVVQNDAGNRTIPVTIVAPVTDAVGKPRIPQLVPVSAKELGAPDAKDSVVDCGQLRAIDSQSRVTRRLGRLEPEVMARVDRGLAESLGLSVNRTAEAPQS